MGLFGKALAVGVGYALGRPEVRQKLAELVQHPKVKQLRDQATDVAGSGLETARRKVSRSGAPETTDILDADSAPTQPYAGALRPSPSPHDVDKTVLQEGVLPPAEPGPTSP
ncbi:MAG TPA: hypothetical protein VGE11_23695 [Pseudonocardia sp.]